MATEPSTDSRRTFRFLVPVVFGLLAAAGWVSWMGTRGQGPADRQPNSEPSRPAGPIVTIDLPRADLELPPGPHHDRFQVACSICHSPRLPLTQPPFSEKKWAEIVHKMVAVYGAPLSPREEREVTDYLTAVRGP